MIVVIGVCAVLGGLGWIVGREVGEIIGIGADRSIEWVGN